MTEKSRSMELYQRALKVLPGGVSRNAVLRKPHPAYLAKGEGCYLIDLEGTGASTSPTIWPLSFTATRTPPSCAP
jgi:hypothetical protein